MALVVGAAISACAQDSEPSLGDVARQARAQRAVDAAGRSRKTRDLDDDMQQQEETPENVPAGFESYDSGEYRLLIPFPHNLEGRDGGAVWLGSQVGVTNTEVMAGEPIPIPADSTEIDLLNLAHEVASGRGQDPYCAATTLGMHRAFRCRWSGASHLMGSEVVGTMLFVVGSSSMIPVMCATQANQNLCLSYDPTSGLQACNQPKTIWEDVQRVRQAMIQRDNDARRPWQACDQIVYPSIEFKEDIVVHPARIAEKESAKPAPAALVRAASISLDSDPEALSLAELARQTRQARHAAEQATLDNTEQNPAPAGYKSFPLPFCLNPHQCSQAAILIPESVEVVSRVNAQYTFKALLDGAPVMLYAGPAEVNDPYRSMTDRDYVRMRDLMSPNGWSREKADGVSSQEVTIDGKPALVTRFRYQRDGVNWWIGERALVDVRTSPYDPRAFQFFVACTAAEENFAAAQEVCTTLVNSLKLSPE